ncbi:MAG: flotillin family protein, partial [Myxococcales bacterium]|nr:flotillin family protein [Myxococcales bacterium]
KGGIPLNVDAVANLKIASTEPTIGNAIARFLDKDRGEIIRVAKETLEGNLRGVLAALTPEEVNQDRVKFQQSLMHEAEADLNKLGLVLDTLKIQNVSDDKGYLDSIGRRQTAELLKRSRIAEADNRALSAERDAENLETKETARIQADMEMLRAEAQRRVIDAQTKKVAMIAEQEGEVRALIARYEAELDVQKARIEQTRHKLDAERLKPAEARKAQLIEAARAGAAPIIEEGKATAASLRQMSDAWRDAGPDAGRIFVAQKLGVLIKEMLSTVQPKPIQKVTVIDATLSGDGTKGNPAVRAAVLSEQVKETLGVDVPALLRGLSPGTTSARRRSATPPEQNDDDR